MQSAAVQEAVVERERYYTIAEAARALQITYQRVMYAIGKKWMIPYQEEPMTLIPQSELDRYEREHLDEE